MTGHLTVYILWSLVPSAWTLVLSVIWCVIKICCERLTPLTWSILFISLLSSNALQELSLIQKLEFVLPSTLPVTRVMYLLILFAQ